MQLGDGALFVGQKMVVVRNDNADVAWAAIVPIFKLSLAGEAQLVGTGFFITNTGVLVTAKHVITDNIGADGKDVGGIAAFHYHEKGLISRPLLHSSMHETYDLALCETQRFELENAETVISMVLALTLEIPAIGAQIATHSYHAVNSNVEAEKYRVIHSGHHQFKGVFTSDLEKEVTFEWRSRVTGGYLIEYFEKQRDSVMMPFPCFHSDTPIYAGMSGGPVFDDKGRVFALNCSRVEGTDAAFHVPIAGILDLFIPNATIPGDDHPRKRTVRELAVCGAVSFFPPL
jgi:hypothetical protein